MNAPEHIASTTDEAVAMFAPVPETTLPDGTIVPAFLVSRYVCTRGDDGKAAVSDDGAPWVRINYHEAREACAAIGGALITERQWLAIAHNAATQACNWTKGAVGEGKLFRGIRFGDVSSAQPGTFEPTRVKERRWLMLSNGERLCDLNGNVFQWIFDDVQGDDRGLTTIIKADSPSLQAPFPPMKKGMGWRPDGQRDWSGAALIRGGYWYSEASAGAFRLGNGWPDYRDDHVGFRCTKPIGL